MVNNDHDGGAHQLRLDLGGGRTNLIGHSTPVQLVNARSPANGRIPQGAEEQVGTAQLAEQPAHDKVEFVKRHRSVLQEQEYN